MTTNEILQTCKHIIDADEDTMVKIMNLGGFDVRPATLHGYLQELGDKEFLDCGYEALGSFLDGLIVYKRGESSNKSSNEEEVRLNNNLILKKLRIAFELKDVDMYAIFNAVDIEITKGELNSLFRKEGHKNFRVCPDSILQLFLEGLRVCEGGLQD
jgi:uncharacterized protein YehS (DUF1456 family)